MKTEYIIVWGSGNTYAKAANNLANQTRDCMKEGWQPQGGINSLLDRDGSIALFQALVK